MARSTSWMPLALGVVLLVAVVGLAHFAADRVDAGLRGVARVVPTPPDIERPELVQLAPEPSSTEVDGGSPLEDGPHIDLEYPTERDWLFLEGIMRDGTPEARRSAAKALVVMGGQRGVPVLFEAARQTDDPDADLFCLAALDVLRLQRWEDTLPALLEVTLDQERPPSQRCRSEVSDRFAVAGGRDPERLAGLAGHSDARIRGFVAAYLMDVDPDAYRDVLEGLAQDPDPDVRLRAGGSADAPPGSE